MSQSANHNLGININVTDNYSRQLQNFERSINSLNTSLDRMTANLRQVQNATSQSMSNMSQQTQNVNNATNNLTQQQQQQANTQQNLNRATKQGGKSVADFRKEQESAIQTNQNWLSGYSESVGIALRSVAIWGVATTAIYGTKRALQDMMSTIREFNTEMVAVQRVMNRNITNFEEMTASATSLAIEYATAADEVVQSMVGWARQGQEQVEVIELTEAALLASNVAQMDAASAVEYLTSAILQFNESADEAVAIVDRLNDVANNYAVTAEDLAMSIRESGAAAHNAGVTMDELIGITASLSATTAKSGNRIGRTLRTTFSRMMGDAQDGGEALGQVEIALNSIGVALRETETDYRSMTDVLTDLAVQWDTLDGVMQANIARAMGGRRRYSDVISLMENWDMALDATETSMNSLNSAIEENEIYMESIEGQMQQASAQFDQLAMTIGDLVLEDMMIGFANATQSAYNEMENFIVGVSETINWIRELDNRLVAVLGTIGAVTTAIKTNLIPAISSLAATILGALGPVGVTIGALGASTAFIISKFGEKRRETEAMTERVEEFNQVLERANELSVLELENAQETIDHYKELSEVYLENAVTLEDLNEAREGMDAWRPDRDFADLPHMHQQRFMHQFREEFEDNIEALEPVLHEFSLLFADEVEEIQSQFEGLSPEEELLKTAIELFPLIQEELQSVENRLESSVSWINKYSLAQAESIQQGRREAQMLQQKQEEYERLSAIENKTEQQTYELQQVMSDLTSEFYELAVADDFSKALDEIVQNQLHEFSAESENTQEVLEELRNRFHDLADAEEELEERHRELSKELTEATQAHQDAVEEYGAHSLEATELGNRLEVLRSRFLNVNERMVEVTETQKELSQAISMVEGGYEALDTGELISHFQEAKAVMEEFREELLDIRIELEDYQSFLEAELTGLEWEASIRGLEDFELLERQSDAVSGFADDLIEAGQAVFELEASLESAETRRDIELAFEELDAEAAERLGISPEDVIEDWFSTFEEAEDMPIEEFMDNLLDDLEREASELLDEADRLGMEAIFSELLEVDSQELHKLEDDVLQEYREMIDNIQDWIEEEEIVDPGFNLGALFGLDRGIDTETARREMAESLEEIYDEIESVTTVNLAEILFEDDMETTEQVELIVKHLTDVEESIRTIEQIDFIDHFHELQYMDFSNLTDAELDEVIQGLSSVSEEVDSVEGLIEEAGELEFASREQREALIATLNSLSDYDMTLEEFIATAEDELQVREASNTIRQHELELMDEYERNITELTDDITKLVELESQISDRDLQERISDVVDELESQKEVYEAIYALQQEDFGDQFDFSIDEDLNMMEIRERSNEIRRVFEDMDNITSTIADRFDLSAEQAKEVIEALDLDEDAYDEAMEQLDNRLEVIARNWQDNFSQGVDHAIDILSEIDDPSLGQTMGLAIHQGIAGILSDEETFVTTMQMFDDMFGETVSDWDEVVQEPVMQGLMSAIQGLQTGDGRSALAGVGETLGSIVGGPMGSAIGGAIGDTVGAIGEMIFAPDEQELQLAEDAQRVNESISEATESLGDFGVEMDSTKASVEEVTGLVEGFFGGESWDISGFEDAEASLEQMENVLSRLESRSQQLGNDLANAVQNSFNYNDMYNSFRQSVGEAMIQATLDAMIESAVMQEHFDVMSGQIENAISDGYISDEDMQNLENSVQFVTGEMEELRPVLDQIEETFGVNMQTRQSQTFRAGATTSITYHNNFTVQAGAFLGNEREAKKFSQAIAKYIKEVLDKESGN